MRYSSATIKELWLELHKICGQNIHPYMDMPQSISSHRLTSSDDDSCDRCIGIETSLDDLGPTEQGVPLVPVRAVGGGVLGEGRLCHRNTLTYMCA